MVLLETLLQELNFVESPNLDQSPQWSGLRSIANVDAVYTIENTRIAYFSEMTEADPIKLFELYKSIWNESEAPLLYVSLPHEIRVYNCYAQPPQTPEDLDSDQRLIKHLKNIVEVEDAIRAIRSQLSNYDRIHLDSEAFWNTDDGANIRRENRADQQFLRAMLQVRSDLVDQHGLSNDIAYEILGRSIFIQYLEDRGFLTPDLMRQLTGGNAENYRGILTNAEATYKFFDRLGKRFSGDMFPVGEKEKNAVLGRPSLLISILDFLKGTLSLGNGVKQLSFWPFDFRYIPMGLISELYDTFIENRKVTGAYYTSQTLVDFVLEETLPPEKTTSSMKILDPACGSGAFLVRAYQRLINAWRRDHNNQQPKVETLSQILSSCIYGCDINEEAARIAVFNLYLAMLDYVETAAFPQSNFKFPRLLGKNVHALDFFSEEFKKKIANRKFDRIIGNPPWGKNTLTPAAQEFINTEKIRKNIGSNQIVQAFMIYAPDLCVPSGEVAFLAPAKSTILVKSGTHARFRDLLLTKNTVRLIVNLSALRQELFGESISPSIAIFYRQGKPDYSQKICYCVPKPSPLFKHSGAILVDSSDVKFIALAHLLENPNIWKTALWGNHRDISIISRLGALKTLKTISEELGWEVAQGFQLNGPGELKPASWLHGMKYIPTNDFRRYVIPEEKLRIIQEKRFYRGGTEKHRRLFTSEAALVRQGTGNRGFLAAFKGASELAFKHKITGIIGNSDHTDLLKWLVVFINSDLVQYYAFMTSTSWAVERDIVIQLELLELPFLIPDADTLKSVAAMYDSVVEIELGTALIDTKQKVNEIISTEKKLNQIVYEVYSLTKAERIVVEDAIRYTIDFFYWSQKSGRKPYGSLSVQKPNTEALSEYSRIYLETINSLARYQGFALNARVFLQETPLCVVEFIRTSVENAGQINFVQSPSELERLLFNLDRVLLQRHSSIYMRRHLRIYEGDHFYLIRPSENRYWTRAQALADADETINEWLQHSRDNLEVQR